MNDTGERPLLGRDRFHGIDQTTFLYTGAHAPALREVEDAIVAAYRQKSRGVDGRDVLFDLEDQTRESIGALVGRTGADVGLLGDASTAWSGIAHGWEWRPGDNIVVNEYEHPAVFAPFLRLRERGLEVRVAPRAEDWTMPSENILALCDDRTIAVGLSHVGYVTGLRHDLDEIGRALDARGIPLLLDVSHSLGVVEVDLTYAALAVSASYKWLLGPYGVGAVIWNRDRLPDFRPGTVGWRSLRDIFTDRRFEELEWHRDAARFQMGAPALADIAGLGAGIRALQEVGLDRVQEHALALGGAAHHALQSAGFEVLTPAEDARRAGSIALAHPDGEAASRRLADRGIFVWGGDGRLRASFHVMNDLTDVDVFVEALVDDVRRHEAAGTLIA